MSIELFDQEIPLRIYVKINHVMILFLKRINILLALILLSLALGIVKFKNNLPNQKISNFDVDAIVVLTGGKGERIIEGYNQIENSNQKTFYFRSR